MLEWAPAGWWLATRFVRGAINRWRASEHESAAVNAGLRIESVKREERAHLPAPRVRLALPYLNADERDLRTTAIDLIARRV